uniref:ABC transmembrane type-1 domain-containing protein n=1 Tax=Ditylenchus dipsaci TaxID=166011 RepID=A0A915EWE7_9BILA
MFYDYARKVRSIHCVYLRSSIYVLIWKESSVCNPTTLLVLALRLTLTFVLSVSAMMSLLEQILGRIQKCGRAHIATEKAAFAHWLLDALLDGSDVFMPLLQQGVICSEKANSTAQNITADDGILYIKKQMTIIPHTIEFLVGHLMGRITVTLVSRVLDQPQEDFSWYEETVKLVSNYILTVIINTIIVTMRFLPSEMTWFGYIGWLSFSAFFFYAGQRFIIVPFLLAARGYELEYQKAQMISITFCYDWQMTIIMACLAPLMILTGAFMARLLTTSAALQSRNYAAAGPVAEQAISSIRTVTDFNGQEEECRRLVMFLTDFYLDSGPFPICIRASY